MERVTVPSHTTIKQKENCIVSQASTSISAQPEDGVQNKLLFWGCFIALITTSYAFISRMILCGGQFVTDFGLDKVAVGELQGAGIWPFGVSIIVFSLFIDRIGYKTAMIFSFVSYLAYTAMALAAYAAIQGVTGTALVAAQAKGVRLLTWGSIILGLGNGAVEAYINPVVATLFNKEKVKWLNILHAGWPAGLVLGGLCTIGLAGNPDWRIALGLILVPAIIFFLMLIGKQFPKNEREQAGVGYVDMLKELGAFGALVGFGLVFWELGRTFGWPAGVVLGLTGAAVVGFAVITKSIGRPILLFLILIMMPLATTEIGTDGWISSLMEGPMKAAGHHPGWVLVYTSAIMMVLRFFAGPIVHRLSPLGLLASCSVLAIVGLTWLSKTNGAGMAVVFAAATLYAVGKTFFWPTMLGVTSEQCPKGGALTLNAMGGIGMLAVGILGFPFIGFLQESSATAQLKSNNPALYQTVTVEKNYLLGQYHAIDPVKSAAVTEGSAKEAIKTASTTGQFSALGKMAVFPAFMLAGYIALIVYFKSKGGYKAIELVAGQETGGIEGPGEA
jgi:MFS family permease